MGVVTDHGTAYRADEVILSGGSYGSPAILLRSGVGPAAHLKSLGIDVVADLPVGQRLHDHPGFYNAYALAPEHARMTPAVGSLLWTASSEAVGDELDLHVTATHLLDGSASPTGAAIVLATAVVQPESRGTVTLASTNPNRRRSSTATTWPPHATRDGCSKLSSSAETSPATTSLLPSTPAR
jgi:choline dehydrogenase